MDDKYYLKYLEYKNKYLALKGGMMDSMNIEECKKLLEKRNTKYLDLEVGQGAIRIHNKFKFALLYINFFKKDNYPKLKKLLVTFLGAKKIQNMTSNLFPDSLQKLQIIDYQKKLVENTFPVSLKYLYLNMTPALEYTIPENVLPENLETLILTGEKIKINSLPKNLKHLSIENLNIISEIKEWPKTLTILDINFFGTSENKNIINNIKLENLEVLYIKIYFPDYVVDVDDYKENVMTAFAKKIRIEYIYIFIERGNGTHNRSYKINYKNEKIDIIDQEENVEYSDNTYYKKYKEIFDF